MNKLNVASKDGTVVSDLTLGATLYLCPQFNVGSEESFIVGKRYSLLLGYI